MIQFDDFSFIEVFCASVIAAKIPEDLGHSIIVAPG